MSSRTNEQCARVVLDKKKPMRYVCFDYVSGAHMVYTFERDLFLMALKIKAKTYQNKMRSVFAIKSVRHTSSEKPSASWVCLI